MSEHIVYILIGSNTGNRFTHLTEAIKKIEAADIKLLTKSEVYETAAWGPFPQPSFLNQLLIISTYFDPETLMQKLLEIEKEMGRVREQKMGPRNIDLDILFYDNLIYKSDQLTIPHPLLHKRNFVLYPLQKVKPGLMHPVLNKTVKELFAESKDTLEVCEWKPPEYD